MEGRAAEFELDGPLAAALFRALAQSLTSFVSCIDRQRRVVFINRTLSRNPEELLGQPMEAFLEPQNRDQMLAWVESAFQSGKPGEIEFAVSMRDGSQRRMHARLFPFRGAMGAEFALLLTEDMTERQELVAELERSVEFRRRIVEHLPDFVSLVDRERRFIWVNRVAPGLTIDDVIGKRIDDFSSPDAMHLARAAIDAAFDSKTVGQYEVEGYRDPTTRAWYLVRVAPVVVRGNVEHVLLINSDITERKRAERALRATEDQLRRAQHLESLGQLAGGIAHDFNNLLQVIAGNLAFALDVSKGGVTPIEELEQAVRATERAAELTSQLLAIGRRKRVELRRVELGALVAESVRMVRRAILDSIEIVYERPQESYFVELDAPQFEHVLINLCVNARDAMPAGGTLTLRIEPDGAGEVMVCVSDTGHGIAPSDLARVFEPFFTTKRAGSGLGLAVAAGIVAAHGGVLTAESDGKSGTTMRMRLPRLAPEAAPKAETSAPPEASNESRVILVAEDEELVRVQLVRILERAGYRVLQAENGMRALSLFREHVGEIELALLDVMMPELDGWRVFLELVELKPTIKVLFMTGYAANVLPHDFGTRGARLVTKPYKPQHLLAQVRELLLGAPVEA